MVLELIALTLVSQKELKTEVQATLCNSAQYTAGRLEFSGWQVKRVGAAYFVDNAQLDLYRRGWVIRIRMKSGESRAEVSLKKNLPEGEPLTNIPAQAKCEYDLHGQHRKTGCKIDVEIPLARLQEAIRRDEWVQILSPGQRNWLSSEIPLSAEFTFTDAFPESAFTSVQDGLELGADLSSTSDGGADFVEISVKVKNSDAVPARDRLYRFLAQKQLHLCEDQQTRLTEKKLRSFFR